MKVGLFHLSFIQDVLIYDFDKLKHIAILKDRIFSDVIILQDLRLYQTQII